MSGQYRAEVMRRVSSAEAELASTKDGDARLQATLTLGRLTAALGEARAVSLLLGAVDLAEGLGRPVLGRAALIELGRCLVAQGDVALGRGNLERGLGEAQRGKDPAAAGHAADAALGLVEAWLADGDLQRAQAALSTVPAGLPQRHLGRALVAREQQDAEATSAALSQALGAANQAGDPLAVLLFGARCEGLSAALESPSLEARVERLSSDALKHTLRAILAVSEAPQADPWSATADALRRLLAARAVELQAGGIRVWSPTGAEQRIERTLEVEGLRAGIVGGQPHPERDLAAELLLRVSRRFGGSTGAGERVLHMLDRLVESDLEGPQLFELAVQLAVEATGAARGRLLRVSGVSSLEVGEDASFVSRSLLRHVVLTGRPLVLEDASESPPVSAGESVGAKGLRSVLAAPLLGKRGRVLGVLYLDDPGTAGRFGPGEAAVAVGFAARLGPQLEDDLRAQLRASGRPLEGAGPWIPPALLESVRSSDVPVLVSGESGVGKEHFARAAAAGSKRAQGPFVVVSCGTIPDELLESELFGHEQGAFTGAHVRREGMFQRANGGVLFFDGLQDASPRLQAEVLRAVERGEVRPLGGQVEQVDVRVIGSYAGDPARGVSEGRLRQDLYYRFSVLHVTLPPLRERKGEIPALARALLTRLGAPDRELSAKALARLESHTWPGNLRELQATLERALVEAGPEPLKAAHLRFKAPLRPGGEEPMRLNSRQLHLVETLTPGQVVKNADHAVAWGISPATAWRDLVGLAKAGLLVAEGKGRGAIYRAPARTERG
ncbi:MAG: sigma 54-interacting transcriptional regulator [Planctomycetota bacterium]